MVAEQVEPVALEVLQRVDVDEHDLAAPQVTQLALVEGRVDVHLLDVGAGLLEDAHGVGHDPGHPAVHRVHPEVGAERDAHARDRAAEDRGEVVLLFQAERVPRVVARQHVQRERGVLDGAGERALEEERRGAAHLTILGWPVGCRHVSVMTERPTADPKTVLDRCKVWCKIVMWILDGIVSRLPSLPILWSSFWAKQ